MLIPISNRKQFFLIDGIGALVSAFFLGVVLVQLEAYVGMPIIKLYVLSAIALIFACYSLFCFAFTPTKWQSYLRAIAIINTLYCCLTLALVIRFFSQLTLLGLAYFVLEIMILFVLIRMELLASKKN